MDGIHKGKHSIDLACRAADASPGSYSLLLGTYEPERLAPVFVLGLSADWSFSLPPLGALDELLVADDDEDDEECAGMLSDAIAAYQVHITSESILSVKQYTQSGALCTCKMIAKREDRYNKGSVAVGFDSAGAAGTGEASSDAGFELSAASQSVHDGLFGDALAVIAAENCLGSSNGHSF